LKVAALYDPHAMPVLLAAFWARVEDGEPELRRTAFDLERAAAEIEASGWPVAEAFVAENLRAVPSRDEAIEYFERGRIG
jgi:hypothetical protein